MFILVDARINEVAKSALASYGEIVEFSTRGITYDAISGHPDIFFCPSPGGLIVAPNLPKQYFSILRKHKIHYITGILPVGNTFPESARYNSLVTEKYLIQNPAISDSVIQKLNPTIESIAIKQGYTRCSLLALPNGTFITSDRGIEKKLKQRLCEVLFVNPHCIELATFEHGFFGGICGMYANLLFVNGSLSFFKEETQIRQFVAQADMQIVELHIGKPVDIGTILFLQ